MLALRDVGRLANTGANSSPARRSALVSWTILGEHGLALALICGCVSLPGLALLAILRLNVSWATAPLLGIVYWTVSLYLLPFAHGLDVAIALSIVLVLAGTWIEGLPSRHESSWTTLTLLLGSLPYASTLLFHYVPFGMDGSMHTTAATLIARAGGLPTTHAPFADDVPFPPMNLGLPTVAAVAIRLGADPASAMLACHHLTFTSLILASYVLLTCWTDRATSALLSVATVWMARASQASLEWGGFPTVLSIAVGLLAGRLLFKHADGANWRLSLATGAAVMSIPLVHGIGGGTWLYCVAPWITAATMMRSRAKAATVRGLFLTVVVAAVILMMYRSAGLMDVTSHDLNWTHDWQRRAAPLSDPIVLGAFEYVRKDAGSMLVVAGWIACGMLAVQRQWLSAMLVSGAWLTLAIVVANSQWWVLPASFLLYPERTIYWVGPLSAVGLALAWRAVPTFVNPPKVVGISLAIGMLILAGYCHNQYYQRIVRSDFINEDRWEALAWAKQNLRPGRDFVHAPYGSTGAFLPGLAHVGCTGAHHHHFVARAVEASMSRRKATHMLVDRSHAPDQDIPRGRIVFSKGSILIVAVASP